MKTLAIVTDISKCSQLVQAGLQLGGALHLCLLGGEADEAKSIARFAGVSKVLHINAGEVLDTAEAQAEVLCSLENDYSHLLSIADTGGKNLMPRVAAMSDRTMVGDLIKIISPHKFQRPIYAGNAIAEVECEGKICLTVRAVAFGEAVSGDYVNIDSIRVQNYWNKSKVVKRILSRSDRADLGNAKIVVCGGRGFGSKEAFDKLLYPLADRLGAAIGASRAAVDAGYVTNDYQVGQTGKIIAPDLYIAIGVSGAIQHLAGMMDSRCIVAINKDKEAPIFQVADYGLVGDLFNLVPQLTASLG